MEASIAKTRNNQDDDCSMTEGEDTCTCCSSTESSFSVVENCCLAGSDQYCICVSESNESRNRKVAWRTSGQISPFRVAFDEELNVYHENDGLYSYDETHAQDFWYSAKDYAHFRVLSAQIAGSVNKAATSGKTANIASSLIESLSKSYEACCSNDSDSDTHILTESEHNDKMIQQLYHDTGGAVLIGLEKAISWQVAQDVQERRKDLVFALEDIRESNPQWISSTELSMEIREFCEQLSRPSKLFARQIAAIHAKISS